MPSPATATPTGRSQIAPRRSDQRPKSGWITDEETAEASMIVAARVYERPKRSTRNGRSAGSAPFAKSVPRCPAARSVIARLSMPLLTTGRLPTLLVSDELDRFDRSMQTDARKSKRGRGRSPRPLEAAAQAQPRPARPDGRRRRVGALERPPMLAAEEEAVAATVRAHESRAAGGASDP